MASGKTAKSILISCGARLAPFDIAEIRDLMSYDEMELDTIGDRKTALFVIISDTDDTFNFIVAMMYTQLFNLLCDKADDVYGGRLPCHVRLLLDEFANIGQIPKFDKLIATIRSREISASIILQSQSQLKTIYKDAAETILGNCDSLLFLGGKESSTLKEISETLGKETIDLYNTSDTRGQSRSYGLNYQKTGKELLHLFVKSSVAQSENSRTGTRSTGFLSQIKAYQNWYSFRMEECDDRIETADPGERDLVYACRGLLYPESDAAGRRKKHRRYGRLHREYLKETKPHTYNDLILTGRLWTCLADLDEQAEERLNHIIRQFREKDGVTEELKKQNQMEWVRRMNSIRIRTEEIILHEMIYV